MTIALVHEVWEYSRAEGSALLLLLKIADNCQTETRECWPSIAYLARYTRLSDRQVQRAARSLAELGELEILPPRDDRKGNTYRLKHLARGVTSTSPHHPGGVTPTSPGGDIHGSGGVTPTSPKPLIEPKENQLNEKRVNARGDNGADSETARRWRKRVALFGAYCDGLGISPTSAEAEQRRHLTYGALIDPIVDVLDVTTVAPLTRFVVENWAAAGIRQKPRIEKVLEMESAFAQWRDDGSPPVAHSTNGANGRAHELASPGIAGADGGDGGYGSWSRQGRRVKS